MSGKVNAVLSGLPDVWESIDGRHGGAVVGILEDGRLTFPLSAQALMVQRPEGLALVDDDQVHGWRATCSCFWQGEPWKRTFGPASTDLHARRESIRPGNPCDPSRQLQEALYAEWQAHACREVALTELAAARREEQAVELRLQRAAAAGRAAGLSWEEIATVTGMKKQSAHQRWRDATL